MREWNVIEFKGLTDHAEVGDLELLVSVGTGLTVKINEARNARDLDVLANRQVAFWYVAPLITEAFAGHPASGATFKYEAEGVWSGWAFGHPMFLVSVRELPRKVDSLPLHLLDETVAPSLAEVFAGDQALAKRFSRWLIQFRPNLWREVVIMNPKVPTPISWEEAAKIPEMDVILEAMETERLMKALLKKLTPEQAIELVRRQSQGASPPCDGEKGNGT